MNNGVSTSAADINHPAPAGSAQRAIHMTLVIGVLVMGVAGALLWRIVFAGGPTEEEERRSRYATYVREPE